jgi:CHAT domain-containing protein/Flp pilus assembly protein TadD
VKGSKPQRTDLEYEVIFSELLEGVNQGWSRGETFGFLIGKRIDEAELIAWLHRFGENLQATPEQHQELARRMVLLGEVYGKELGKVAGEIGKRLLAQVPQLDDVPSGEVIEADVTEGKSKERKMIKLFVTKAEVWFEQGNQQYYRGDFLGAIASFDKALAIQPDYHHAWINRGVALVKLGRFEEAIASYDKALAIKPENYQVWNDRGVLFCDYLNQFEEAIVSFNKALAIQPDDPTLWCNRGVALRNSGQLEAAIRSFDKAVAIQPDYANGWNNRGVLFCDYLNQFEEAILSFDQALAIQPDDHDAWYNRGNALHNLGRFEEEIASYDKALAIQPDYQQAWYNRGNALRNLGRFEEEIASYDKALAIQPDDHKAWINRGIAAGNSPHYYSQAVTILQMQFPRSPAVIPNPTLNQRGYEGALLCYQEGLKHCPQETHPEGWGMLHQFIGKAHYVERKNSEAVTSYNQALKTLTSDAFPELHLEVLQDLIKALLGLRRTPEAEQLKRDGTDLLQRLLAKPKSQGKKEQLAFKFVSFQQLTVDIAIQHKQIIEALETAEAGKNACLSWLLYAYSDEITSPNYAEIQQLLQPTTAIVYWHLSPAALTTFIIKHGETPKTLETPETDFLNRLEKFEDWVKDWNQQYAEYGKGKKSETEKTSNWRDNLPEKLQQLREILHIPEIETTLTGITHLILIPHRDLHRFPLHDLFADKFTITYLPSAKIGLMTQGKNPEKQGKLLSVEDPNSEREENDQPLPSLPFAKVESEYICRLFPNNNQRLPGDRATQTAVETELSKGYAIFHFTGHGSYNFHAPKKSALCLTKKQRLRMENIVKLSFANSQLVCLSACETAITGNQTITSEYVGLVSAFLSRGVSQVVSTLWTVQSDASALVMMQFYHLRQHQSNVEALNQATRWLRDATATNLAQWYQEILQELEPDEPIIRPFIKTQLFNVKKKEPSEKPYHHPYHWAGFIITGRDC